MPLYVLTGSLIWLSWERRTRLQIYLRRLIPWIATGVPTLAGALPLFGADSNPTIPASHHSFVWLPNLLIGALFAMAHAGGFFEKIPTSHDDWIRKLLGRSADAIDDWDRRELMVAPEQFQPI